MHMEMRRGTKKLLFRDGEVQKGLMYRDEVMGSKGLLDGDGVGALRG